MVGGGSDGFVEPRSGDPCRSYYTHPPPHHSHDHHHYPHQYSHHHYQIKSDGFVELRSGDPCRIDPTIHIPLLIILMIVIISFDYYLI